MRVVVVYESMFGNTREVAAAIAEAWNRATVTPVAGADAEEIAQADLLIVGAPTHMLGLSRPRSRQMAVLTAAKPERGLTLEPGADGKGVREWLAGKPPLPQLAAVFDTRLRQPAFLGHAARSLARRLRRCGAELVVPPASFFVGNNNRLESGELDRARGWGAALAERIAEAARSDQPGS